MVSTHPPTPSYYLITYPVAYPLITPYYCIPSTPTHTGGTWPACLTSTYPLNTSYQYTSYLHILSTHLSTHPILTPINTPYPHTYQHTYLHRWDLACVLDLANGQGTTFTPDEKKRMGDFDVSNYRGSSANTNGGITASGGGGGGVGSASKSTATTGSSKYSGNSSSGSASSSLMGGLATVGGRLMSFDSPESAQQYYQDINDARFITASLSGTSPRLALLVVSICPITCPPLYPPICPTISLPLYLFLVHYQLLN